MRAAGVATVDEASCNDPLANFDEVAELAAAWKAGLHDAGAAGHLNPLTGIGPWPDGLELIAHLAA